MKLHRLAVVACAVLACVGAWPDADAATRELVVQAGDHDRLHVPLCIDVPDGTTRAKMLDGAKEVPCQVSEGKLWWVLDALKAGEAKSYVVDFAAASGADADAVKLERPDATVDITIAGKPFTTYLFAPGKPAGHQLRRPCFFPVFGPDQTAMTRPFPLTTEIPPEMKNLRKDHPHHTSIWVAHGDVNGVDNWSISGGAGWQLHRDFQAVASGAVMGLFREDLDWTTRDRKPVLAETRTVRVYRLPHTHRMLDLEIAFHAKYGKVVFGDTKEGGLCATRMRPEFRANNKGRLVNAQGKTAGDAWGKESEWVDASGTVGEKRYGFAIFDHPRNLRHPTTWHARTYGLLTANPFGLSYFTHDRKNKHKGDHTLEEGETLTFRYRIYFHVGDEKQGAVAARYADYAQPPTAAWK
ncbi:MAG: PmoA family protein [Candidatus Brocadiia bacterium]